MNHARAARFNRRGVALCVGFLALIAPGLPVSLSSAPSQMRSDSIQYCENRPQPERMACVRRRLAEVDAELIQAYQELLDLIPPDQSEQLRNLQLQWLGYREQACRFQVASLRDRSRQSFLNGACLVRITEARLAEIRAQLEFYSRFPAEGAESKDD